MPDLTVSAAYEPTGDQPRAIAELAESIGRGDRHQTLLGATATGKTHTMARVIERLNRPTLVIAHNKTLAAQLCNEFREYFPRNAVEYFVSYYDYYQPEAYLPSSDTYIEKDSSINDDIDRLRHAATAALFARRDVVIVASVSCIYGIGSPESYSELVLFLSVGEEKSREDILRKLVDIHYQRNDVVMGRGRFRVRGDVIEVQPANMETAYRISLFGDEVEAITHFDPMTGEVYARLEHLGIYPATHYAMEREKLEPAIRSGAGRAARAARRSSRPRARCSRPTGCARAPSTTWRCCARSASATASRTTRGISTAASPARRATRCSTTSPTTS